MKKHISYWEKVDFFFFFFNKAFLDNFRQYRTRAVCWRCEFAKAMAQLPLIAACGLCWSGSLLGLLRVSLWSSWLAEIQNAAKMQTENTTINFPKIISYVNKPTRYLKKTPTPSHPFFPPVCYTEFECEPGLSAKTRTDKTHLQCGCIKTEAQ